MLEPRLMLDSMGPTESISIVAPLAYGATSTSSPSSTTSTVTPQSLAPAGGTWTPLANLPPGVVGAMLLLSDGSVMVENDNDGGTYGPAWYRLTPDSSGSYVNGTWSTLASMNYTRLFFSSQVLTNGNVYVAGGEYGTGTSTAEVYNTLTNTWTVTPSSGHRFSDANSEILPNGNVLEALVEGSLNGTLIYNPSTNSWASGPTATGITNESAWVKLPDNSILMVNRDTTNTERYIPSLNQWVADASAPVSLYDPYGSETGPGSLLPNGKVIFFGATGHTAIYTPSGSNSPGTWVAGPDLPNGQGMPDAPDTMMPDGNILLATAPIPISGNVFQSPTSFYEYNYLTNSYTQVNAPTGGLTESGSSFQRDMLLLPNGTVLSSRFSSQLYVYTPVGSPLAAGQPTVTSVTANGDGSYLLSGTLLNGISEGSAYGDDFQMATNYPIVQLTSGSNVYYARTYNWSSTGVMTGSTPETTDFTLPAGLPLGTYSLSVIANGIASAPVTFGTGLLVTASTPASGAVLTTPPLTFSVTFNLPFDPASISNSSMLVNGVAASSFNYSGNTINFTYATSPVTQQGLQTMSMAAGAILQQSSETPMTAFSSTFRYDALPMQVVSTSPVNSSVVEIPFSTITVGFNEAILASSLSSSNIVVNQGTVTGATQIDSQDVRYTVSGVTQEGNFTFSFASGASGITDAYGNPGPTYTGNYTLDFSTVAYPLPLTAVMPAGSLIYDPIVSGNISPAGDTDSFTLALNAGQTLTLLAAAAGGLQPRVDLTGPGLSVSALASAAGQAALLQSQAIGTTGTYTITISGLNSTTGAYTLQATVNAALQNAQAGGPTNSTQATAQDISSSFLGLGGGGSRGAVVGTLSAPTGSAFTSADFTSGSLGSDWSTYSSDPSGAVFVSNNYPTVDGNNALFMDRSVNGAPLVDEAVWNVSLTGQSDPVLSFLHQSPSVDDDGGSNDSSADDFPGAFAGHTDASGVAISVDGVNWYPAWNASSQTAKGWQSVGVDLGAVAAKYGLTLGSNVLIKFQQYDDQPVDPTGGAGWAGIALTPGSTSENWYSFTVPANQTVTLVAKGSSAPVSLELHDSAGNLLASGASTASSNVDQAINNYAILTAGTYYARVIGTVSTAYTLVVTKNADFDNDSNSTLGTAQRIGSQQISGQQDVLGFLDASDVNIYQVTLLATTTLNVATTTPGDGTSATANTLDPKIEVFNSSGTMVAADDNSAADGRNAQLSYAVPSGAGGTYYIEVLASPLTGQPTTGNYVLAVQGGSANHAPVLNTSVVFGLSSVAGDTTSNLGNTISALLAEGGSTPAVTDADPGALAGIAITAVDSSHGTWQFSTSGGANWISINSASSSLSQLLAADGVTRLRFIPNLGYSGTVAAGITFVAWDQTAGTNGGTIDTEVTGGTTAFSTASATASLVVTPGNLAPTLLGTNNLSSQLENNSGRSGTLVKALVSGEITDPDLNAAQGIAVTGANTANGSWQYSTSGSNGPWLSLGSVSTSSARLLAADNTTLVRFVPNSNFSGTVAAALTFRAWDQTSGSNGGLADTTSSGGATAFSLQSASTTLSVIPLGDTRSWVGGGPDNNWSDGANWVGGVAPSAGDSLVFAASALQYTSVDDFAAGTQFNSVTLLGGGYSITGNGITLTSGFVANNATGSNSFTAPITLATAQTFDDANPAATLTLGAINTGVLQLLTIDGSGTVSIGGTISGSGGITKNGSGTLILSGSNTYLGITTINQGVVNVQSNSALGATTAGTTVISGAALQVQGNVTIAEPLSLAGTGTVVGFAGLGALRSVGGTNNWTGNVLLSGVVALGVDSASLLNISGTVTDLQTTGNVGLTVYGGGTLELSGTTANLLEGFTEVFQGTLLLAKSAGVTAVEGSVLIGDNLQGSNASVLRLGASGQIPQMDPTGTVLLTVTVNPSGLLDLNNFSDTIGSLTMVTGATYSANVATGTGLLTLGGGVTLSSAEGSSGASPAAVISGKLDLGSLSSFSGGASAITTRVFNVGDTALTNMASDLTISAVISGSSGISLSKSGAGTLTLTGANNYTGSTILSAGTVEIGNSSAFGNNGLVSLDSANLRAVNGAQTIANPITIDNDTHFFGSNNLTFTGPATLTGTRILTVLDSVVATFSGGLGEGVFNASGVTVAGTGTLALTGANSYSGSTTINPGATLTLGGGGTLLYSPTITVNALGTLQLDNSSTNNTNRIADLTAITLSGGTLDFVGASGAASTETLGAITLSTGTSSTIESDLGAGGGSSAVLSLASLSTNSGASVSFVGTGAALSSSGSNQINVALSPAALTNGILPFATVTGPSGLDLATYVGTSAGVAMIALPAADYVTSLAAAGPTSNVKLTSSDTSNGKTINALLVVGNFVNVGGASDTLTVSSGAVAFVGGASSTLSVSNLVLGTQAFITTDPGLNSTISGVVTGAATSFTKAGAGTLVLSGANQFAGADYINGGVLTMQNSAALGATSGAATVNAGATLALQDPGGSPVVVGTKALTINGTGYASVGALENISGNSNYWAGTIALNNVSIDSTTIVGNWGNASMATTFIGSVAGQLSLTGVISGAAGFVKVGGGTVALGGVLSNTFGGSTVVEQGTLLLDKSPGLYALGSSGSQIYVSNDQASASPGQLVLGANNQLFSTVTVSVDATGTLNFNNFSNVINSLFVTIGPNGSGSVSTGSGILTATAIVTVQAIGTGNPSPATISGNLALAAFGTSTAANRSFTVNDGATGDDLVISASISDGTGLASLGITKAGLGTLQFAGTSANAYTGTTTVSEGTLELNKSSGVSAFAGPLVIGSGILSAGGANAEVVRLLSNNQTPSAMAPVSILSTGLFDLNGYNDTIGGVAGTNALTITAGSITTGTGTLTLNGDVLINAANLPATISGNLNLGSSSRTFFLSNTTGNPFALIVSASISGAAGVDLNKTSAGVLVLTGANTYSGRTYFSGPVAVGSDSAFGTGAVFSGGGTLQGYGGAHVITNTMFLAGAIIVSGADSLTLSGAVNLTAAINLTVSNPINVTFSGGIGETVSGMTFTKLGAGFVALTGFNTYSGATTVSAGWLTLKDSGTDINTPSFTVSAGAVLRLDNNSAANLADRVTDTAGITLNGGTLLFVGAPGVTSSETIGSLTLGGSFASTVISQVSSAAGSSANLTFSQLTRNSYSTVSFIGAGVDLGATNQIDFTTAPTESGSGANAILPYATVISTTNQGRVDLATLNGLFVTAFTAYATGNINSAAAGSNYLLDPAFTTSPQTLTATLSLNAVLIRGSNQTITSSAGKTLNIASGALVTAGGGTGNTISVTTLDFGTNEGIVNTSADLAISSAITGTSVVGLTKAGSNTLTLSGSNTYSGQTIIDQGVVSAQSSSALGASVANAVQTVTITNATSGTFELYFNGVFSSTMNWNASAATMQGIMNSMSSIGGIGGSVTVTDPNPSANPNVYTITFGGTLAGFAQPTLTVFNVTLAGSGVVTASSATLVAGGTAGDGTVVTAGAALQLAGNVSVSGEQLTLNGAGVNSTGALQGLSGTNTWNGNVVLSSATILDVDPGDQLNLGGTISGGSSLAKIGTGTLQYTGATPNAVTGTTTVSQGTLILNKTAGIAAIAGAGGNALVVGDDVDQGTGVVQFIAAEQLSSLTGITLASTGTLQVQSGIGTTQAVQLVQVAAGSTGNGTFTLTYGASSTSSLSYTTTPAALQTALNNLSSISSVGGSVSVSGTVGNYYVQFTGSFANTAISTMTQTLGSSATGSVSVISTGGRTGTETVSGSSLTLAEGSSSSSVVTIANGTTLTLNSNLTVNALLPGLSPTSPGATISNGSLGLALNSTSATRTFTINDGPVANDLVITSTIIDGSGSTTSAISKGGNGRLVLNPTSGSNTYGGTTTISAGQLNIQQAGALGTADGTATTEAFVSSFGALELAGVSVGNKLLSISGTGVTNLGAGSGTGALINTSGINSWSGNVVLSSNSTIAVASGSSLTLSGAISGSGFGITKILPGTLTFFGSTANTYSGTTSVSEGTLILSKANVDAILGPLTVGNDAGGGSSDVVQLAAANQIDTAAAVTIDSSGWLDLNGYAQTLGSTVVNILTMEYGQNSSAILSTEAGILTLGGATGFSGVTFNGIGLVTASAPAALISGNLNLGTGARTVTVSSTNGVMTNNAQISATITGSGGGALTKAGTGTLLLSVDNSTTYSGPTTLSAGTIALGNNNALGTGGVTVSAAALMRADGVGITLPNAITMSSSLTISGNQNFSLGGAITVTANSLALTVTNSAATTIGSVSIATSGNTWFVNTDLASTATLAGSVTGAGNFEKSGVGRLTVTGAVNVTGTNFLFSGVLAVSSSAALGTATVQASSGSALEISGSQTFTNTLNLNDNATNDLDTGSNGFFTGTLRSTSGTNVWSGPIVLNGNVGTSFIGVDSGQLTLSNVVSAFGGLAQALAKVGLGTLVMSGASANTYTGLTTVDQGTLVLNKSGTANAIGTGGIVVGDGGGVRDSDLVQYGSVGGTNEITDTASVTVYSSGKLDLGTNSASDTIGYLTLDIAPGSSADVSTGTGTLTLGGSIASSLYLNSVGATDSSTLAATISGNLSMGTGGVLFDINGTQVPSTAISLWISAVITGSASLTVVSGTGVMQWTAADSYSGSTWLYGGTLALAGSGSALSTSFTVDQDATLLLDNAVTNLSNRLSDTLALTMAGGNLSYVGEAGVASSETIGALDVTVGDSTVLSTVSAANGSSVALTFAGLALTGAATGTLQFRGSGAALGSIDNQILFAAAPTLIGGIIPYARLENSGGLDFAAYDTATGVKAASYVTSLAAAGPNDNVILSVNETLTGSKAVNAILFAGPNVTANLAGFTLTLNSGVLATRSIGAAVSGGALVLGAQGFITADSADDLTIGSAISGSGGLVSSGIGTLILTSANTYAGQTAVNEGTLNIQNGLALGATGVENATSVFSGASLTMQGGISVGDEILTLAGTGINNAGALESLSGTNTWGSSGTVLITPASSYAAGLFYSNVNIGVVSGQLVLNGTLNNSASITEVGFGTLQLAGSANNLTGYGTTVDNGVLQLNKSGGAVAVAGNLTVGDGVGTAQVQLLGNQQIASTQTLTVNRGAQFDSQGFSQSLTGVTISDGTVTNSGAGGTLTLSSSTPLTFNGGTLNSGAGAIVLSTAGTVTANAADMATIAGNLTIGTTGGTDTFSVADGPALDDLVISATVSGQFGVTKSGTGTLLLSAANSYSATTTLSAGTLAVGSSTALGTGNLSIVGGTLRGDGGNQTISNPVSMSGTFTLGGRGDLTGTNTGIDLTTTQSTSMTGSLSITVDDPSVLAEIDGGLTTANGYTLSKSGEGTLILAGAGTYSGATTVIIGVLNIRNSAALGTGSVTVSAGAELDLQGNLTVGNKALTLSTYGFVGNVTGTGESTGAVNEVSGASTWGTGTTTITLSGTPVFVGANSGATLILNGTISGSSNTLNKVGLGTVQLAGSASNVLAGTTTVYDGTLQLNKSGGTTAMQGPLVIGDNAGSGTDTVQELAAQQLPDSSSVTVTVNSTGLWDLSEIATNSSSVQTITITGAPTGGTFTLTYNGQTTTPLAYNAPTTGTGSVQSALQALAGTNNVSVSGTAGSSYVVTFQNALAGQYVPTMTASSALLTGGTSTTIGIVTTTAGGVGQTISGTAATTSTNTNVLTLVVGQTQSGSVSTGNSMLALDGVNSSSGGASAGVLVSIRSGITTAVPATISGNLALVVGQQAATRAITVTHGPGANDLVVSANIVDGTLPGNVITTGTGLSRVVFSGNNSYSGQTTVSTGVLNLQSSTALGTPLTSALQSVTFTGAVGGTFTLTFGGVTTATIPYNAAASVMQADLAALSSIGAGNINVTSSGTGSYAVMFQGSLAGLAETTMTANGFGLIGTFTVTVATIVAGGVGTSVTSGAALELQGGVSIASEPLALAGTGPLGANSTALGATNAGTGALRNVANVNTWGGNIVLTATSTVGIDAGQLTLSALISGSFGLTEVGGGTLVLAGTAANTYSGTTTVNAGTLILHDTIGVAMNGSLVVGDGFGGKDAELVQFASGAANQIPSTTTVTVAASGKLDLATGTGTNTISTLVLTVGPASSADVITGTGALTVGAVTGIGLAGASSSSSSATVSGNLKLSGTTVTFKTNRTGARDDVSISAAISGSTQVVKNGWGTLVLSGNNSFTGGLNLAADSSTVVVTADGALGASGSAVTVNADATLAFRGGVAYATSATITLNGSGAYSTGALVRNGAIDSLGGNNSFSGSIVLGSASTIAGTTGLFMLNGSVSGAYPLTVTGAGSLYFNGNVSVTSTSVSNALLGGNGTFSGPVTFASYGSITPGNLIPGILSTGTLTLNSNSTYTANLNGATAGTSYNQVSVSGVVNLAGAPLVVNLSYVPSGGDSYTLVSSTSPIVGTFAGLPQGTIFTVAGIAMQILYSNDQVVLVADHAPAIASGGSPTLSPIYANQINNGGTLVSAIIASGGAFSDQDGGALQGIAVDGLNNTSGTWQFSTNGGSSWTSFGAPNDLAARLLASDANTRVRFVPGANYSGTVTPGITFRAWDGTVGTNGSVADATLDGGAGAYSAATESASILVDAIPVVVGAYASGTNWGAGFYSDLDTSGLGDPTVAGEGFKMFDGASQLTSDLPWTSIDTISIAFSEFVNVGISSLTLYDSSNNPTSATSFSYDATNFIAHWTFPSSLAANIWWVGLTASTVTDQAGTLLDGDWTTGSSTFAQGSGDGTPGGDFNFLFNVLPGDVNNNGIVSTGDVLQVKTQLNATLGANNYRQDINANGVVTTGDVLQAKTHLNTSLSQFPTPVIPPAAAANQSADVTSSQALAPITFTEAEAQPQIFTITPVVAAPPTSALTLEMPTTDSRVAATPSEFSTFSASYVVAPSSGIVGQPFSASVVASAAIPLMGSITDLETTDVISSPPATLSTALVATFVMSSTSAPNTVSGEESSLRATSTALAVLQSGPTVWPGVSTGSVTTDSLSAGDGVQVGFNAGHPDASGARATDTVFAEFADLQSSAAPKGKAPSDDDLAMTLIGLDVASSASLGESSGPKTPAQAIRETAGQAGAADGSGGAASGVPRSPATAIGEDWDVALSQWLMTDRDSIESLGIELAGALTGLFGDR
jgi:fibronectin-binding autotransporter adhesin